MQNTHNKPDEWSLSNVKLTLTVLSPKVYIDAQGDPEEGNLGTLPVAMQVLFSFKFCFIRDHSNYWKVKV